MYQLIIANKNYSSWSMRPWVLMRGLDIAFQERLLRFDQNRGEGDFRRFTPSGRVPCLVDGDTRVWDSLAIAEYLAERHPAVWPAAVTARAWARCAAAEMHSGYQALRDICSMSVGLRVKLHHVTPALQADLNRLQQLWEEGLQRHGGPYLAGSHFTAVDAFFAPVATRVQTYDLKLSSTAQHYAQRLLDHAAVKEWVAAGVAETFRDKAHEADFVAHGSIVADLRAPQVLD